MKKTAIIVTAIAAVGIAVFALSGKNTGRPDVARNDPAASSNAPSSRTERIDDSHAPDRFDSLNDETQNLALDLEKAAIKWQRNRLKHEGFHRLWNDWRKYSIERISSLSTEQIRALGDWLDSGSTSELQNYRQAIIMIWSAREPEVVRKRLLKTAEWVRSIKTELDPWEHPGLEGVADDFHQARVGHAMKDPSAAWQQLLDDAADSGMKDLVNVDITLPALFREYSTRAPEDAWHLALTANDEDYCRWMIEGFTDGAPAGQDWEKRGQELAQSLADRNLKVSYQTFQSIGERWLTEDPLAALDWYARCAPEEALQSANNRLSSLDNDPFAETPPPDPADAPMILKAGLLVEMYDSHKDRTREVTTAIDYLNTHGEDQIVVVAVSDLVGTNLHPMKIPLLEVIVGLPSAEDRNTLFLQAVRAIPIRRGNYPFAESRLDGPNASLAAVRDLAARLNLPDEIRAEAEAAFGKVEAEELKALEALKQKRRDGDDPFSSR